MGRTTDTPAGLTLCIRPATGRDAEAIARVSRAAFPEYPETPEEIHASDDRLRAAGYVTVRAVAEAADGVVVGHYRFQHMPEQFRASRYRLTILVHPAWQRRGIGGALYDHALASLLEHGATEVESFAWEAMPRAVAFLERRGFREVLRNWELRLDLRRFDPAPFEAYRERVRAAGVRIVTLAEERERDPDALRRAYELHNAVVADIPAPIPFTPPTFEHYLATRVDSPRALLDAYFLAKVEDAYVGEANLERPAQGAHLYHHVTGVLPGFRGRGIAMALKLATIAYGASRGYAEIRTWNAVHNAGMLAINERLGFVRQPAWITYEKTLAPKRTI
jgi:mycothiol synthase